MHIKNHNELNRQQWLAEKLSALQPGIKILDAGAGELRNRIHCGHLQYISQDFCQYDGGGNGSGLQAGKWNNSLIDIVSDITCIPLSDDSIDAILCSEVLEHVPDPLKALDEFSRLLKPGGTLIITAPFSSLVHFAPYHYCTGFSKYWYEFHLPLRGFEICELVPNGDWYSLCRQEILRLGAVERSKRYGLWPVGYCIGAICWVYFKLRGKTEYHDLGCFGWHLVAKKM